jgi:hypothetical protein
VYFKKISPSCIYNQIIYTIIKNKFLNSYCRNKLQNNNYKNINNINAFFINPKKFINKFKELDISNNKNLNKFLKKSKEIIRNIDVNRYIKY